MANVPRPRSYTQILGETLNSLAGSLGIRKIKIGGPLLTILEASARQDSRVAADVYNSLLSQDIDNLTGLKLDNYGNSKKIPRRLKRKARGKVTVSDTAFTKQFSKLTHSNSAPIVGSIYIYLEKGATFDAAPSTGNVYLGRNTANYEGPLAYSAKTSVGTVWRLTLSSPTAKFHNQGETVVLAQGGDRIIPAGSIISTPTGALTTSTNYSIISTTSIPDGENSLSDIDIVATIEGEASNVPAGAIQTFQSPPFSTATVTNENPVGAGRDSEKDPEYRERIRQVENNKAQASDIAIKNEVIGVYSPTESSSILSASILKQAKKTTLVIDDGTGYQEKSDGQGYEVLCSGAIGGEKEFRVSSSPIAQAYLETNATAPFSILDGSSLTVSVGEIVTIHTFDIDQFYSATASAYDIIASINKNPNLNFYGRVTGGGNKVAIYARSETNDDIQILASDNNANDVLGFNTYVSYTTTLYKNDTQLVKDGLLAQLISNREEQWGALSGSQTLTVELDSTPSSTYTFTDADFIPYGGSLAKHNTQVWSEVFNSRLPGITATYANGYISLTSNRGRSTQAQVNITGGTLVENNMFVGESSQGANADYTVDRSVGAITLANPLVEGDTLTLGTNWPEAYVQTPTISDGINVTSDSNYWVTIDDPSAKKLENSFIGANTTALPTTPTLSSYVADVHPITPNCKKGDWVLFNDPGFSGTWSNKPFRTETDQAITFEAKQSVAGRFGHTATALTPATGKLSTVLLVGGLSIPGPGIGAQGALKGRNVIKTAEIYNPNTGVYTPTAAMITPRAYHTATLLGDGRVYVCGGFNSSGVVISSAEIYDPVANIWSAVTALSEARAHHTAVLLASGFVLIVGGWSGAYPLNTTVEYNAGSNAYVNPRTMISTRYGHSAIVLAGGDVIVAGGVNFSGSNLITLATAERYTASSHSWAGISAMPVGRAFFGFQTVSANRLIAIGDLGYPRLDNQFQESAAQETFNTYLATTDTWGGTTSINAGSSWTAGEKVRVCQPTLGRSLTTGKVCLFNASFQTIAGENKGVNLIFDGTEWDKTATNTFSNQIPGLSGCVGVGLTGNSTDTVAWFGGVPTVYKNTVDVLDNRTSGAPAAITTLYDATLNSWLMPNPLFSSVILSTDRLIVTRSETPPQKILVDTNSGVSYMASTLSDAINSNEIHAEAEVYKTSKIRLSSPSLTQGAILPIDKDFILPSLGTTLASSKIAQLATTVSSSDLKTPFDFTIYNTGETSSGVLGFGQTSSVLKWTYDIDPQATVLGLKSYMMGSEALNSTHFGNIKNTRNKISSVSTSGTVTDPLLQQPVTATSLFSLRSSTQEYTPGHPVALMEPMKFAYNDKLILTIDGNTDTQRYTVPMFRKVIPNDSTYGNTIYLKDGDNNNNQIQAAFGNIYSFNDFVLLSRARAISNAANATLRVLWRYSRYGAEGNSVGVRFVPPIGASTSLSYSTNVVQDRTHAFLDAPQITVDLALPAGAKRTSSTIVPSTRLMWTATPVSSDNTVQKNLFALGFQVSQGSRATSGAVTSLRLTWPSWAGSTGVEESDVLYYQGVAPSPTTLLSGQFVVQSVTAGAGYDTVTVKALKLHDGTSSWGTATNPGSVSLCATAEERFDNATTVNDWFKLSDISQYSDFSETGVTDFIEHFPGTVSRISAVDTNFRWIETISLSPDIANVTGSTQFKFKKDEDLSESFQIWASNNSNISTLVTAMNGLPLCPISGVFTGSGPATVTAPTWESTPTYFRLKDGVNWVSTTTNPATISDPTGFTLKKSVDTTLSSYANDFSNEIFYIGPAFAKDITKWLNTKAITGLSTCASIVTSNYNEKVQISSNVLGREGSVFVEGGKANMATAQVLGSAQPSQYSGLAIKKALTVQINDAETDGFTGGQWVKLTNTNNTSKVNNFTNTWGDNNKIQYISRYGDIIATSPVYREIHIAQNALNYVGFEKIGDYTAIILYKGMNRDVEAPNESGYVRIYSTIATTVSSANCGVFKILRVGENESCVVLWIHTPNTQEEQVRAGIKCYSADSIMPGDTITFLTDEFGIGNKGSWTVSSIGDNFEGSPADIHLDVTNKATVVFSGYLNTNIEKVGVSTSTPMWGIKKVLGILPAVTGNASAYMLLDNDDDYNMYSESAGTIIQSLGKMGFDQTIVHGRDAYRYNTGLIAESKKVVYGDRAAPEDYPGMAAEGANIQFAGPTIKRIQISVAVRLTSNVSNRDIVDNVKSTIAGYINSQPIGVNIPLSGMVSAIESLDGVSSVAVVSPTYNASNDLILISSGEKAMIINSSSDITVSTIGI